MTENNSRQQPTNKNKNKPHRRTVFFGIIAGALILFMCLFIPTGPMKKYNRAKADVVALKEQLTLAYQSKMAQEARLREQETLMERLRERQPSFDLWSFLNSTLAEADLKERATLENYKPRADNKNVTDYINMVQMSISGVTLNDLIDLFHKIYAGNNLITIYRLEHMRPAGGGKGLECKVIFLSPKPIPQ